jgi:DNA-binding NarL/FixJ family response regulator
MADRPIRVLCVDDHEFLAEGMKTKLSLEPDLEFVSWLESAEHLIDEVSRTNPDVILLDIEMPGPDSFSAMQDVRRRFPDVRTIMLSAYVRDHYIDAAFKAGAWGYVSKSDDPSTVVDAIRKVFGGAFAFGPKVLERCQVTPGEPGRTMPKSKLDQLTHRETEILRMIGKGLSRTQIAEAIHRSPKTVDNHRAAIMEKLGIRDRVELARYAIAEGLTEV